MPEAEPAGERQANERDASERPSDPIADRNLYGSSSAPSLNRSLDGGSRSGVGGRERPGRRPISICPRLARGKQQPQRDDKGSKGGKAGKNVDCHRRKAGKNADCRRRSGATQLASDDTEAENPDHVVAGQAQVVQALDGKRRSYPATNSTNYPYQDGAEDDEANDAGRDETNPDEHKENDQANEE
jgi:hypothetical protein